MNEGRLCFKIDRSPVEKLLDDEIILHNIREADKTYDTQYMMSACTAWLRKNKGKTLKDFEELLIRENLNIRIIATDLNEDFEICLPGGEHEPLKYVGIWMGKKELLDMSCTVEPDNTEKLRYTGFSCNKGMASVIENCETPTLEQIKKGDIKYQLQWAGMKVTINQVEPEKLLQKDISYYRRVYGEEPDKVLIYEGDEEQIYAFVVKKIKSAGEVESVSEFGIKRDRATGVEDEIHILAYFLEQSSTTGLNATHRPTASNSENRATLDTLINRQLKMGTTTHIELTKTLDLNGKQIVSLI
jgi:hypothetical protein